EMPLPDFVDGGVDDEFQQEGCEYAADHRRGDPLHHVGACPCRPHDRHQPHEHGRDGHELWPNSFHCAVEHCCVEVAQGLQATFTPCLVIGQVEIEQHEDAGLGVDTH